MDKKFPERKSFSHEISTQDELDFLISWLQVLFQIDPNIRGKVNGLSISLTGKFVGIDQSNTLSICKVEE